MNPDSKKAGRKKPYRAPVLVRYGDLARLTNTVGKTGILDGGKGGMSRTRP